MRLRANLSVVTANSIMKLLYNCLVLEGCAGQAVGLIGMTCYLSYLAGDEFKLSGIVSLFCCAVAMSHYGLHNISKHQRAASLSAFETLSSMAEGSVFVYVGLDSLDPQKWAVSTSDHGMQHSLVLLLPLALKGLCWMDLKGSAALPKQACPPLMGDGHRGGGTGVAGH